MTYDIYIRSYMAQIDSYRVWWPLSVSTSYPELAREVWFREDRLPGKKARNRMKWSLTAGHSYRCEQNQKWRGPREEANQGKSCWLKDRPGNTQGLKHNRETEPAGIMFKSGIVSRRKRSSVTQPQSLWRMSTSTSPNDLYGFSIGLHSYLVELLVQIDLQQTMKNTLWADHSRTILPEDVGLERGRCPSVNMVKFQWILLRLHTKYAYHSMNPITQEDDKLGKFVQEHDQLNKVKWNV